ncbi:MAG: hypothetical protein HXY48_06285 [Ignavibacteriaceae bacterium]|nr:hypothetical protein [Ignavibacteriaceae bacterium]
MKITSTLFFAGILSSLLLIGCQSEPNAPNQNLLNDQASFNTVDNDLALMKDGGMRLDSAAGVFSIGWNEMFRPFMDSAEVKGMSFAVAFGERNTDLPHFKKFGLDMGDVFINYTGNHIEMHKRFHERRGTAYSLFKRPFGHSENLLEYIPNTEYQFEVTGSEFFAPITITLTSPNALMDITSPANGQVIDPTQDLTINWEGGKEGKVGVRLMPHLRPHRGPGGGPGGMGENHPPFDRIIFVILETNTGIYTFSAEQIQRILNGIPANGLMAEVSQMDFGEVEHENGTLHTAMKNGSSVMMRIQQ